MESGEIREASPRLWRVAAWTITLDNGLEFADFRGIERDMGVDA
jgi:IS30 family transposase